MIDILTNWLTNNWKEIIESIIVDGVSRKVESVNCFRMSIYNGYQEKEYCYKVNFNLENGITDLDFVSPNYDEWHKKLIHIFTEMFLEPNGHLHKIIYIGETSFKNDKVDYMTMTDQGYRFIIQFYPLRFLSQFRNDKLNKILK